MKGLSDAEIRTEWTKAGGSIWGPNIETVGMPEISYFNFRRELERDYKRLSALCTRQGIELMELADLQSQVARLKEALKEAMGWNWLDGDVPSEIQTQCEGALESESLSAEPPPHCECHRCIREKGLVEDGSALPLSATKMVLCPECGNKRCPKASDHRLLCTKSNEPGQPGSVYASAGGPSNEVEQVAPFVQDRLTCEKASKLCEQYGYVPTGYLLSNDKGLVCSVNLSKVQWFDQSKVKG